MKGKCRWPEEKQRGQQGTAALLEQQGCWQKKSGREIHGETQRGGEGTRDQIPDSDSVMSRDRPLELDRVSAPGYKSTLIEIYFKACFP